MWTESMVCDNMSPSVTRLILEDSTWQSQAIGLAYEEVGGGLILSSIQDQHIPVPTSYVIHTK